MARISTPRDSFLSTLLPERTHRHRGGQRVQDLRSAGSPPAWPGSRSSSTWLARRSARHPAQPPGPASGADRVVCCSEFVRRRFLDNVPLFRNYDVTTLHPGTVVPESQALDSHEPPVIVATSQLNPDKGHQDLFWPWPGCATRRLPSVRSSRARHTEAELRTRSPVWDSIRWWNGRFHHGRARPAARPTFLSCRLRRALGHALEEGLAQGLPRWPATTADFRRYGPWLAVSIWWRARRGRRQSTGPQESPGSASGNLLALRRQPGNMPARPPYRDPGPQVRPVGGPTSGLALTRFPLGDTKKGSRNIRNLCISCAPRGFEPLTYGFVVRRSIQLTTGAQGGNFLCAFRAGVKLFRPVSLRVAKSFAGAH